MGSETVADDVALDTTPVLAGGKLCAARARQQSAKTCPPGA